MPMSTALRDALLDAVYNNTAYSSSATVYLALCSSAPAAASFGTEISGGSYARQEVTTAAVFGAASSGVLTNTSAVTFTNMPADTVTHAVYTTHSSSTDASYMLHYGALTTSLVFAGGETQTFAAGDLTIAIV